MYWYKIRHVNRIYQYVYTQRYTILSGTVHQISQLVWYTYTARVETSTHYTHVEVRTCKLNRSSVVVVRSTHKSADVHCSSGQENQSTQLVKKQPSQARPPKVGEVLTTIIICRADVGLTTGAQSCRHTPATLEADHASKPHTPLPVITGVQLAHILEGQG